MNKKVTQSEIARRAGIRPAHLSMIINGSRRPSWSAAKRLAEVTGTTALFWLESEPDEFAEYIRQIKGKA